MNWTVSLAREVAKQLERLPADRRDFLRSHLRAMGVDPFVGDVKPLKGKKWRGRFRKRVGRYRIIFTPFHRERHVEVSAILLRNESTYR